MQTLKRKWQNFKSYRQLHELWNEYKSTITPEISPPVPKIKNLNKLLEFLESFKTAMPQSESSSDRKAQTEEIFGDCTELLEVLLSFLKYFLENSDPPGTHANIYDFLTGILEVLELLSRSERYKKGVECAPAVLGTLSLLFEKHESQEGVIAGLRLISCFGVQGKKVLCETGCVQRMLQLLLSKDECIIRETVHTLKAFLESPAARSQQEGGFRKQLTKVIGGVTKLAWSFFPSEDSSRSNEKISEDTEDQPIFPPPEAVLRSTYANFQGRFAQIEEVERAISAGSSPRKEEIKQELIIDEFCNLQGTVTVIIKCLTQVPIDVKLNLLTTLSLLMKNNVRNQKEFRKVDGYMLLSDFFNTIPTDSMEDLKVLENAFKILINMILSGKDLQQVENVHAFRLVLHLAATSTNAWVVKGAIESLQNILNINWENVVCFYDQGMDYLNLVLERNVQSLINPILHCKNSVDTFGVLDETLRYISFLLGNAWEKNTDIIKIYSDILQKHAGSIEKDTLKKLVQSLQGAIADINVRCNKRNALVRSSFLGCLEGMKLAATASLSVLDQDIDLALPLIAHLLEYELLYTETLLNSALSTDSQNTLYPFALVSKFSGFFKISQTGRWIYEKYLVTKCTCEEIEVYLLKLIEENELMLVVKILMMEEYSNIDRLRANKARERFLCERGIQVIRNGLPALEYFWLMLAASKNSAELKYRLSSALDLRSLAAAMPASIESLHILLELATNGQYLERSEYLGKISAGFPCSTSESIMQATMPHYLFNPIAHSRHSSTTTSTIHLPDRSLAFEQGLGTCPIVNGSFVLALLVVMMQAQAEVQAEIIRALLGLSRNYQNKQVLCSLQIVKLLVQGIARMQTAVHEVGFALISSLASYSVSQEEAGMLIANLKDKEIQKTITRCLALDVHSHFYALQNQTLDTPTITAFSKYGYSLMFWVKVKKTAPDMTPIFSWVDHNRGLVLFKLSLLHSADKKRSGVDYLKGALVPEPGNYLIIQAPIQPVFPAPDDTAKFSIENLNDWVHIAIIHSKPGIVLYVNNIPFPLFKCTNFGSIREKYNVTGVFGSKNATVMVSSVFYIEGALESSQILENYRKEIPEKFLFKLPEDTSTPQIICNISLDDSTWDIKQQIIPQNLHATSPLKYAFGKISAIPEFLSLLKTPMQSLVLPYLCECITENASNYKIFIENGGWGTLGNILAKHEEFSTAESLEYLISAVLNRSSFHLMLKSLLVVKPEKITGISTDRLEGFAIISELLSVLPGGVLGGLLDCLLKLFVLEENVRLFISPEVNGLMVLLELINSLVKESYSSLEYTLLAIFEKILPYVSQEHVEVLLDFLASPELRQHFVRIEKTIESIISIMSVHLYAGNQVLLDKILTAEGNLILFEIARSPSEAIKYAAIRIIGLLLAISAKYRVWFMKAKGFDMLSIILQKPKASKIIYDLLLFLSLNAFNNVGLLYPHESSSVKIIINLSDLAAKALPNANCNEKKIVFVEVFEVLFEIIKLESDDNLKLEVFRNIENMLDNENCEKILEYPFLVWCSGLVKETQHLSIPQSKDSKNQYIFDTFIIKLCLYDLNRASSKCKLCYWINKIPDVDSFREKCLQSLLNSIKSNPDFDSCEGCITNKVNFVKNLFVLLQNCELVISYSEINMKVMHLINLLASCNTPAVRQQMKTIGYFDLRDDLIIQMLKEDLPQHLLIEGIQCFSFETIASQPKFRDSNAVIYFIKFLIEFHSAPGLQMEILNLIRNDICVHEENRKYLRKILENKFFLEFLGGFRADDGNSIAQCFRSMKAMKLDEEGECFPENPTAEDFLTWLNHSEKAKKTIMAQISKHLQSIDSEYKKNYNKAYELKVAKRKKAIDALVKDKTSVQKQVNELNLKLVSRVTKAEERCTQRFQQHSSLKSQKLSIAARKSL